ncbi:MAG: nucleoside deaminase [Bacteroidales bacterium]|nr:nucleoside deaminase [Bacteroidales bacterium]
MNVKPINDEHFMKQALVQASMALEKDEVPVGAVIVCNNQIIARAFNLTQTLNDPTAHAEMQAFTAASDYLGGKYLNECTLYVSLEPCVMCAGAAFWVQIGRVVYGAADAKRGYSILNSSVLHPKTKTTGGILAEESELLLKTFFSNKRKNNN